MDLLTLFFLVAIVLASGGIAVFADWLGRNLGKKRLSVAKLRPKTTAQIGTFVAGVSISTVTILFLLTVSSDVRDWIREGRAAIAERKIVLAELSDIQAQFAETSEANRDLVAQRKENEIELKKQRSEMVRVTDEKVRLVADSARLRNEVKASEARVTEVESLILRVRDRLQEAQSGLRQARIDLADRRKERERLTAELGSIKRNNVEAVRQFNEANRRTTELDMQISRFEAQVIGYETRVAELVGEAETLERARAESTSKLEEATQLLEEQQDKLRRGELELARLESDLGSLTRAVEQARIMVNATRLQPMTFAQGEEVARLAIDPIPDTQSALNSIRTLVRMARNIAIERGARDRGPDYPAAGIFPREDPRTNQLFPTPVLENALAETLSRKGGAQVLIAFSTFNAFRGEPVSLEVAVHPNPVVYPQAAVVAEVQVDGRREEPEILANVSRFLEDRVPEEAKKDRMIPRQGSDPFLGNVKAEEVLMLVSRIKETERIVRLQAVTVSETRAADALKLEFRLR